METAITLIIILSIALIASLLKWWFTWSDLKGLQEIKDIKAKYNVLKIEHDNLRVDWSKLIDYNSQLSAKQDKFDSILYIARWSLHHFEDVVNNPVADNKDEIARLSATINILQKNFNDLTEKETARLAQLTKKTNNLKVDQLRYESKQKALTSLVGVAESLGTLVIDSKTTSA